jgi:hypothetical protein
MDKERNKFKAWSMHTPGVRVFYLYQMLLTMIHRNTTLLELRNCLVFQGEHNISETEGFHTQIKKGGEGNPPFHLRIKGHSY